MIENKYGRIIASKMLQLWILFNVAMVSDYTSIHDLKCCHIFHLKGRKANLLENKTLANLMMLNTT